MLLPSRTVQEVEINRQHEDGEKQLVIAWSRASEGVQLSQCTYVVFSDNEYSFKVLLKTQLQCDRMLWRIQDFEKGGSYYLVCKKWQNFLLDHAHF